MAPSPEPAPRELRTIRSRTATTVGAATVVLVLLLVIPAATRHPLPLPLTVDLRGLGTTGLSGRTAIGEVVGRVAVVLPVAAAGLGLLLAGVLRRAMRPALLLITGAASPVVVFLVAQLNGVTDVGALILVYASTAGGVLVRALQRPPRARADEWPLRVATITGIVPWGVIALHQVGALALGPPPTIGVRVTTLVVLAATVAELIVSWRGVRRSANSTAAGPGLLEHALVVLPAALLAVLGLLAIP